MRRIILSLAAAMIGAGALSLAIGPTPKVMAEAGAPRTFLIPQSDGYGLGDCLAEGRECGRIVADAWCESKGFTRAASYGLASPTDFTGSVSTRATPTPAPAPLMISCDA
jgi:hypothetical protein